MLVLVGETGDSALEMKRFRDHSRGQVGLGWAGLGWAGLGWAAGLGWGCEALSPSRCQGREIFVKRGMNLPAWPQTMRPSVPFKLCTDLTSLVS